jgi:hypothetical protein
MSSAPAEETKPASKSPSLTRKQWAEIEALWESGGVVYADLVKKYGKSVSTFDRHFRKHGIVKGAKAEATKKRIAEVVAREELNHAQVLAARITETKEEHYKMSAALARLAWAEVLDAKKNSRPMSTALNNLKALDAASNVLKKVREERFAVLGLDRTDSVDPDAIPELILTELTPEQIQKLRDRDHMEVEDAPVSQSPADSDAEPDDQAGIVDESE